MKPLAAFLLLIVAPAVSFAHGIGVRIDLAGPTVSVTASFDDGDPADDCVVTVTAADGTVVAKGPTDKKGQFTFPRPIPGTYSITADAGAGHLAKKTLAVAAEGEAPAAPPAEPKRSKTNVGASVAIGCSLIAVFAAAAARRRRTKPA